MKTMKLLSGVVLFAAAASAHAAYVNFELNGSLLSYTITLPGGVQPLIVLDAPNPTITGSATFDDRYGYTYLGLNVHPEYHRASISGGAVVQTYAGLGQSAGGSTSTGATYDPVTHEFYSNGSAGSTQFGIGSFCTGTTSVCGALYSEPNAQNNAIIDITFSSALDSLLGTLTFTSTLSNGATLTRVYAVNAQVPLPMSGVLFGSALAGLVGAARRRSA